MELGHSVSLLFFLTFCITHLAAANQHRVDTEDHDFVEYEDFDGMYIVNYS